MRKIPAEFENPIDNYILDIADYVTPGFYNAGFTPNMVTTISNIAGIIVILLLLNAKYYWAALFYMIAYFFDCLDGHLARTYKMTSVFGDYYDHISDVIKLTATLITLYYIDSNKFLKILPIIIGSFILMAMHVGCQEKYYNSKESDTLNFTKKLCPVDINNKIDLENKMRYTKYFGCGTGNIIISACIIYYSY